MDDDDPIKKKSNYEDFSDEQIKDILREALHLRIQEKKQVPKRKELENALKGTMGEFLTCFKLIGYDLNGEPVNLTVHKEKIQKDALDAAFMEEVSKFMNGKVGGQ